jgi:hypothetical protein
MKPLNKETSRALVDLQHHSLWPLVRKWFDESRDAAIREAIRTSDAHTCGAAATLQDLTDAFDGARTVAEKYR